MPAWAMHDLSCSLVTGLSGQGISAPRTIGAVVKQVSGLRCSIHWTLTSPTWSPPET